LSRKLKILNHLSGITAVLLSSIIASPRECEAADNQSPNYLGTASCASSPCHGSVVPLKGSSVERNEVSVWKRHDPHSRAFETLLSARSQKIAKHLGLERADQAPQCLSCHATPAPASQRGPDFRVSEGVSCEACHGAAEHYLKPHVTSTEAARKLGLLDLSKPQITAAICLDCHQGREGSWLTHQLYGAGHPRLSFELDTYIANMPPHYQEDSDYIARKGKPQPAKRWLMGELEKASRQIEQIQTAPSADWPDLASHYCYGCHHSLGSNEWSVKDLSDDPGTPKLNLSSVHLALIALETLRPELSKDFKAGLKVQNQKDKNLKGLAEVIAQAQRALVDIQISREETAVILKKLLNFAANHRIAQNYEVAEQIAMSASSLLAQISGTKPLHAKELKAIYNTLQSPDKFRPQDFRRACVELSQKIER
jgi:hypothetical protein